MLPGSMKSLITFAALLMLAAVTSFAADGPVRHIVAFKFKDGADPAAIKKVKDAFAALQQKIPLIQKIESGTNISAEKRNKGFTHCWIVSFKTTADRDAYLVHPDHKAFGAVLKDVIDDVFVLDFVPKE